MLSLFYNFINQLYVFGKIYDYYEKSYVVRAWVKAEIQMLFVVFAKIYVKDKLLYYSLSF